MLNKSVFFAGLAGVALAKIGGPTGADKKVDGGLAVEFAQLTRLPNPVALPAVPADAKPVVSLDWTMFKQCDSRWAGQQLGTCWDETLCSAGCAMTSVAMMLTSRGAYNDPSMLDVWLTDNGGYYDGCGLLWGSVNAFGVATFVGKQSPTYDEMCNGLAQDHGLIALVRGGTHWVLVTGCAGDSAYYVNDPGFSQTVYYHWDVIEVSVYH